MQLPRQRMGLGLASGLLVLGFVLWSGVAAMAQYAESAPYGDVVQTPFGLRRGVPIQALPGPFSHGGSCVRWCAADRSPCDPDYWKVADKRCNPNQSGYF